MGGLHRNVEDVIGATQGEDGEEEREPRRLGGDGMKAARAVVAVAAEGRTRVVLAVGLGVLRAVVVIVVIRVLMGERGVDRVAVGAALIGELEASRGQAGHQEHHEARREAKRLLREAEATEVPHEAATLARTRRAQRSRETFSMREPRWLRL